MKKAVPPQLDRDQQLLNRISRIEHRVDSIDQTQAFALRADAQKHGAVVEEIFGKGMRRAQIYLAADGMRSVEEIAEHLEMKRQNVGPELKALHEEGMLEIVDTIGNRDIWGKKPIDRTLRITPFVRGRFGLTADGRVDTNGKTKGKKRK